MVPQSMLVESVEEEVIHQSFRAISVTSCTLSLLTSPTDSYVLFYAGSHNDLI